MTKSKIEWTDATWNPVTGCTPVSTGCANCYAKRMAKRLAGRHGYPKTNPFTVTVHLDRLEEPLRWRKPRMVFVCSMGDLFHDDVPGDVIDKVFAVMELAPQHTFQVLTKRPHHMATYLNARGFGLNPLPNVWLGTSVEDQSLAHYRIPYLLNCPAVVRFLSCEPLLGPLPNLNLDGIHWVIVGGESGPGARPMNSDWARDIRNQCQAAGVPFFFKQWGAYVPEQQNPAALTARTAKTAMYVDPDGNTRPARIGGRGHAATVQRVGKKAAGRLLDGREWNEMPEGSDR